MAGVVVIVAAVLLSMASSRRVVGIVMLVGGVVGGGLALYDATIQKNDAIDNAASTFAGIGLPGELRDYFSISLGDAGELSSAVPRLVGRRRRDPIRATSPRCGPSTASCKHGRRPAGGPASSCFRTSRGDMLWLRPDAWAMPRESQVSELVGEAIATGGAPGRSTRPAR